MNGVYIIEIFLLPILFEMYMKKVLTVLTFIFKLQFLNHFPILLDYTVYLQM